MKHKVLYGRDEVSECCLEGVGGGREIELK